MKQQAPQPFTLSALLQLTRFWNLAIIGLAQYFAAGFLIHSKSVVDPTYYSFPFQQYSLLLLAT